jgi:hypothetical protein
MCNYVVLAYFGHIQYYETIWQISLCKQTNKAIWTLHGECAERVKSGHCKIQCKKKYAEFAIEWIQIPVSICLRQMLRAFRKKRSDPRAEAYPQSYLSCVMIERLVLSIDVAELVVLIVSSPTQFDNSNLSDVKVVSWTSLLWSNYCSSKTSLMNV